MSGAHEITASSQTAVGGPTLAWALKRTAIGVAILLVTVTTAACLLYAGIEPDPSETAHELVRQVPTVTGTIGSAGQ